jgi:hypothetical protein
MTGKAETESLQNVRRVEKGYISNIRYYPAVHFLPHTCTHSASCMATGVTRNKSRKKYKLKTKSYRMINPDMSGIFEKPEFERRKIFSSSNLPNN